MRLNAMHTPMRYAVVTGANKGIGLETVRQIANAGSTTIVLTARNEKRGIEATQMLNQSGLSNVLFHQLDVRDPRSIQSLANFVATQFERLDILVNNAGASGVEVDEDGLRALNIDPAEWLAGKAANTVQTVIKTTHEKAKECIDTNYYGVKNVTEALLPLLQLSPSGARIVNVSSLRSELKRMPNEQIRKELGDIDSLTEEKIDRILQKFLHDLQEDALETNGWQKMLPAYSISKMTLNAYTRVLAKNQYVHKLCPSRICEYGYKLAHWNNDSGGGSSRVCNVGSTTRGRSYWLLFRSNANGRVLILTSTVHSYYFTQACKVCCTMSKDKGCWYNYN